MAERGKNLIVDQELEQLAEVARENGDVRAVSKRPSGLTKLSVSDAPKTTHYVVEFGDSEQAKFIEASLENVNK